MTMLANDLDENAARAASPSRGRGAVLVETLRYLAASVGALVVDSTLLWAATMAGGLAPWLAGAIGYGAGLVFIYLLSIRWVFADRKATNARREFVVFGLLGLVGLALNSVVLQVATMAGVPLPVAKLISAGFGFVTNFVTRKLVLFTRTPGRA